MPPAPPTAWMPEINSAWLGRHRAHDVVDIVRRWKAVARRARLNVDVIHQTAGGPVIYVTSRKLSEQPLYFCAGVHGDEPAAVQGLLVWAESRAADLRNADLAMFPLFNPAGIALNTRADEGGHDLNRLFDSTTHPHLIAWQQAVHGLKPVTAVCLHEDYDAQGNYCYELNRDPKLHLADSLLESCAAIIPRDLRPVIEGRRARAGVIQRRRIPMFTNLPEAVALHRAGAGVTLTFETPSEYDFALRTRTHARFVQGIWERRPGLE